MLVWSAHSKADGLPKESSKVTATLDERSAKHTHKHAAGLCHNLAQSPRLTAAARHRAVDRPSALRPNIGLYGHYARSKTGTTCGRRASGQSAVEGVPRAQSRQVALDLTLSEMVSPGAAQTQTTPQDPGR